MKLLSNTTADPRQLLNNLQLFYDLSLPSATS